MDHPQNIDFMEMCNYKSMAPRQTICLRREDQMILCGKTNNMHKERRSDDPLWEGDCRTSLLIFKPGFIPSYLFSVNPHQFTGVLIRELHKTVAVLSYLKSSPSLPNRQPFFPTKTLLETNEIGNWNLATEFDSAELDPVNRSSRPGCRIAL
ncbi:hypothetical protein J6590_025234 [Homalodisca vitripennis]|nr:hypothetical protein J6590_025234 [Homalodisca vitripennis]